MTEDDAVVVVRQVEEAMELYHDLNAAMTKHEGRTFLADSLISAHLMHIAEAIQRAAASTNGHPITTAEIDLYIERLAFQLRGLLTLNPKAMEDLVNDLIKGGATVQ
jgi:hypothetical protein